MSAVSDADEFLVELVDEVLPDLIQAHEQPDHHESAALIERARARITECYLADCDTLNVPDPTELAAYEHHSRLAAEVAAQILNAAAMSLVWDRRA